MQWEIKFSTWFLDVVLKFLIGIIMESKLFPD